MSVPLTDEHRTELRAWLCGRLAEELGLPPGTVDPAEPMSAYGLDSITAVTLLTEVEDRVGAELDPNAVWEFPSVSALVDLAVERLEENGGAGGSG
ncbi:acyl carrier protein [Spirillospora sp. CA-253888]